MGANVCEGTPVTLSVVASGTGPLSYQWRLDTVPIVGATGSSYSIAAITIAGAGLYSVVVSNAYGFVTSANAFVHVRLAPVVTSSPMSQSVCAGANVTFSVTVTGSNPLTYQWRKNGSNIAGATATTLQLQNVGPLDAGSYDLVATNSCGSATSDAAILTVDSGPVIVMDPQGVSVCVGDPLLLTITASGLPTLAYQWRKNGSPIPGENGTSFGIQSALPGDAGLYDVVVTNPCGSMTSEAAQVTVNEGPAIILQPMSVSVCAETKDSGIGFFVVASGTSPLSYQWRFNMAPIPGATGPSYSIPFATPSQVGSYDVVVSNVCGSVTSNPATLTLLYAPFVTSGPSGATVCEGSAVTFTVDASGTLPFSYQWRKNGVPIQGATGAAYTIQAAMTADAGTYDVVVSNLCGSVTSNPATLTLLYPPKILAEPEGGAVCTGVRLSSSPCRPGAQRRSPTSGGRTGTRSPERPGSPTRSRA
jgi:hypothetical protein